MASFISTWGETSTVPADTETPAAHCVSDQNTRNDIYKTLVVNTNVATGALNSSASIMTPTTAGLVRLNTTQKVLELDDGTNIRPQNYCAVGQINHDNNGQTSTSTILKFDLKNALGDANLVYKSDISIRVVVLFTATLATSTFVIRYTDNSDFTTGTTTVTTSVPAGAVGLVRMVEFADVQNLAVTKLYWSILTAGGTFDTTAGSAQLHYTVNGRMNT